mmetsp:Transcript_9218/g.12205  ORF Transcript_9218/g.12205 Transcript_9218/m.12205 type:complete len:189 (+) Transcript_9218:76-642(+)
MPATEKEKEIVERHALYEGGKAFIKAGIISSVLVLAANRFSPSFRKTLGISGKVALAISPPIFFFSLRAEHTATDASRNPEKYGIPTDEKGTAALEAKDKYILEKLQPHHIAANYAYEHPFQLILALAVPSYSTIFYATNKGKHLALSQKIMHTRVYGQGVVLSVLLGTMMFRDFMDRRGGVYTVQGD